MWFLSLPWTLSVPGSECSSGWVRTLGFCLIMGGSIFDWQRFWNIHQHRSIYQFNPTGDASEVERQTTADRQTTRLAAATALCSLHIYHCNHCSVLTVTIDQYNVWPIKKCLVCFLVCFRGSCGDVYFPLLELFHVKAKPKDADLK